MKTGADISHHQANFSPTEYKKAGEDFVILKATEHTSFIDPTFKARWAACKTANLPRACYHFARTMRSSADTQADFFIKTVRAAGWNVHDVWALDFEDDENKLGVTACTAWAERFCNRVTEALGGPGLFYSYIPYIRATMGDPGRVPGKCLAWIARYRTDSPYVGNFPLGKPNGWPDPPHVWQCGDGVNGCIKTVASIGKCDYNQMTDAAFAALFGSASASWWTQLGTDELAQIRGAFVKALG
jgi:GH25 family lysozyme M1 (1,4-beta-N-acetylmuramidase)